MDIEDIRVLIFARIADTRAFAFVCWDFYRIFAASPDREFWTAPTLTMRLMTLAAGGEKFRHITYGVRRAIILAAADRARWRQVGADMDNIVVLESQNIEYLRAWGARIHGHSRSCGRYMLRLIARALAAALMCGRGDFFDLAIFHMTQFIHPPIGMDRGYLVRLFREVARLTPLVYTTDMAAYAAVCAFYHGNAVALDDIITRTDAPSIESILHKIPSRLRQKLSERIEKLRGPMIPHQ
jgi:hypothetical protein